MKQITLALLMGLITFTCYAQERKDLMVSVAAGKMTSPYYLQNKAGTFYAIDLDYYLSKRSMLSANYNAGRHNYFDNTLSTNTGYIKSDGTNSVAKYHTFSILYKYKLLHTKAISVTAGTGAGIMTHSREYPFSISNGMIFSESTWSDLVFPVKLEFNYNITRSFRLGVIGGLYIHPDYPILACYAGPHLSYLLR